MWNFLDVPDEDIIDNFLPRCADTKLLVDMLLLDLDPNDDASTEILEELGRTKSLHITGFSDGGECTDLSLLDHWSQPAPYLQELSFTDVSIPSTPSNENFPDIRRISLFSCTFSWDTFAFTKLTSLIVHSPEERITVVDLVRKFAAMPVLEHLELESALEWEDSSDIPSNPLVFPRLKHIDVQEVHAETCRDFLQMVSAPHATFIYFVADDCEDILPDIVTALHSGQVGAYRTLEEFELDAHSACFSFKAVTAPAASRKPRTTVQGTFGGWEFDNAVADLFFQYYDFSALTRLMLHSDKQKVPVKIWETVLTPLPHIISLDLSGYFAVSFLLHHQRYVARMAKTPLPNTAGHSKSKLHDLVIFPTLKNLTLSRGASDSDDGGDVTFPGRAVALRAGLKVRKYVGCTLEKLMIRDFPLTDEDTAELKLVVGSLAYRPNPKA